MKSTNPTYLNIACGGNYIYNNQWENVDYYSSNPVQVTAMDVLQNLNPSQTKYEVIYCSHFIEHIPYSMVLNFLKRCYSLTSSNGLLRIVVPDADFLLREYLKYKDQNNYALAEFAYINFLDQCVRRKRGGQLAEIYNDLALGKRPELVEYANYINGSTNFNGEKRSADGLLINIFIQNKIINFIKMKYIYFITNLLPKSFREQNISFADVGEMHHWMYDFEQLSSLLQKAGYSSVSRVKYNETIRNDDLFYPLDLNEGLPRKGHHQIFIEAIK